MLPGFAGLFFAFNFTTGERTAEKNTDCHALSLHRLAEPQLQAVKQTFCFCHCCLKLALFLSGGQKRDSYVSLGGHGVTYTFSDLSLRFLSAAVSATQALCRFPLKCLLACLEKASCGSGPCCCWLGRCKGGALDLVHHLEGGRDCPPPPPPSSF